MSVKRKILLVICLIVAVAALGYILNWWLEGRQAEAKFDALRVDPFELLWEKNHDTVGYIEVEDTHIAYPVMQTKDDPEFYLHRDFDKEYSQAGTPFMDAASDINFPTVNWLIYGHNMNNGTMFHDLLKYEDEDFYKAHKTFKFTTIYWGGEHETHEYEVIAVARSKIYPEDSKDFKYYEYAGITTEENFKIYVEGVTGLSMYSIDEPVEYGTQLITLSTCAYHTKDGRFFVVGKQAD